MLPGRFSSDPPTRTVSRVLGWNAVCDVRDILRTRELASQAIFMGLRKADLGRRCGQIILKKGQHRPPENAVPDLARDIQNLGKAPLTFTLQASTYLSWVSQAFGCLGRSPEQGFHRQITCCLAVRVTMWHSTSYALRIRRTGFASPLHLIPIHPSLPTRTKQFIRRANPITNHNFHTSPVRQQSPPLSPQPSERPSASRAPNLHTSFYRTHGRALFKALTLAFFTYQVVYWAWLVLETEELKEHKSREIRGLEGEVRLLDEQRKARLTTRGEERKG